MLDLDLEAALPKADLILTAGPSVSARECAYTIDAVRTGPFDGEPSQEVKHATTAMMRLLTEAQ